TDSRLRPTDWSGRRCRCMDEPRRLDARTSQLLRDARALRALWQVEAHPSPGFDRCVNRKDNPHVCEAFLARGLRLAVLQDAVGEIDELGGELIALGEVLVAFATLRAECVGERLGELVRGVDGDAAFGADDLINGPIRGAEAGNERSDAVFREAHRRGD